MFTEDDSIDGRTDEGLLKAGAGLFELRLGDGHVGLRFGRVLFARIVVDESMPLASRVETCLRHFVFALGPAALFASDHPFFVKRLPPPHLRPGVFEHRFGLFYRLPYLASLLVAGPVDHEAKLRLSLRETRFG